MKERKYDWLLCFGEHYLHLSALMPPTARNLYMALKWIYKKHLKHQNSCLHSHAVKTAFLWFMDEHYSNEDDWRLRFL